MSQLYSVNSLGGYFTNNKLTKKVRHRSQPIQKLRQFTMLEDAVGKKQGDYILESVWIMVQKSVSDSE